MHKRTVACSELFCVLVPSLCPTVPVLPVIALLHKDRRTVRFPASPQLFIGLNYSLVRLWYRCSLFFPLSKTGIRCRWMGKLRNVHSYHMFVLFLNLCPNPIEESDRATNEYHANDKEIS
jgi:hypothetical protein